MTCIAPANTGRFARAKQSQAVMERFPYAYSNRICYYDAVVEQIQPICMLL